MSRLRTRYFCVLLSAFCLLPSAFGSDEYRAYWVDSFHTPLGTHSDIDRVIEVAVQSHANALFVEVRRRGDSWYLDSKEPLTEVDGVGEPDASGVWQGWLEFVPSETSGPVLKTDRETTQPSRRALEYWAEGLEPIYFEGAFARAQVINTR